MARDLSERKELEASLERSRRSCEAMEALATTDGLTGLLNRRELDRQLADEVQRSSRTGQPLAVLMIDADHFKTVNDLHGHAAGDDVLRGLATLVKAALRSIDRVARYGGEELTVLLPDTGTAGALVVAERLRAEIESAEFLVRSHQGGTSRLKVTVSIGVSTRDDGAWSADVLMLRADDALYCAKHGGRNRAVAGGTHKSAI